MFSIDFWFLSEKTVVSRSVSVASRSSSTGAELSSSPNPPRLVGITGTPSGPFSAIGGAPRVAPSSWMLELPVKLPCMVAVVPIRIGTSSFTEIRTRTKPGSFFHSSISSTCPTGTPEKVTEEPLDRPSTDCLKKMS